MKTVVGGVFHHLIEYGVGKGRFPAAQERVFPFPDEPAHQVVFTGGMAVSGIYDTILSTIYRVK
jgi:hypothetical protein